MVNLKTLSLLAVLIEGVLSSSASVPQGRDDDARFHQIHPQVITSVHHSQPKKKEQVAKHRKTKRTHLTHVRTRFHFQPLHPHRSKGPSSPDFDGKHEDGGGSLVR